MALMRIARFAVWLVLAAISIVLVPPEARAHGGAVHSKVGETAKPAAQSLVASHAWSPACPGGSGHVCACGNVVGCSGAVKPLVVQAPAALVLALRSRSRVEPLVADVAPSSSPPPRSHPPRAPPAFS